VRLTAASPFAPRCGAVSTASTLYRNAEVEPSAAVNPANPQNLIAVWQQDRWSDGGAQGLAGAASFDGGRSWTRGASPAFSSCAGAPAAAAFARASDPWLTFAADGTAYFLALALNSPRAATAMLVARSFDGGLSWSEPLTLIADSDPAQYVNDKGAIVGDASNARHVYATWLREQPDRGPIAFTRTTDGGETWELPRTIHDPGPNGFTIGNLPLSLPDGTLLIVFDEYRLVRDRPGSYQLRVLRSVDRGVTWSPPVSIGSMRFVATVDETTGTKVRDGAALASAAVDRSGAVYVAWADSRDSGGIRNAIVVSRSMDGGQTWSSPVSVSDSPAAAFMPSVQARDDGMIGVTYYDLRNDTSDPAGLETDVWLATSTDGTTWTESHVAGPFSLSGAPYAVGEVEGLFVGDYQTLLAASGQFLPVFVQTTGEATDPTDVFIAFAP
jgi:hypothetical protein